MNLDNSKMWEAGMQVGQPLWDKVLPWWSQALAAADRPESMNPYTAMGNIGSRVGGYLGGYLDNDAMGRMGNILSSISPGSSMIWPEFPNRKSEGALPKKANKAKGRGGNPGERYDRPDPAPLPDDIQQIVNDVDVALAEVNEAQQQARMTGDQRRRRMMGGPLGPHQGTKNRRHAWLSGE